MSIFLAVAGPGIIVMIADNDAGGITTYAVTGAQFQYDLIWFILLLGPVAFVVQDMCVRLGAVTKRGHAEAIFDAFGSFWGWFSLIDLTATDWLTIITEFIGMTAALSIFNIPKVLTVAVVIVVIMAMVLQGRYWTWEKIVLVFCLLNFIYIPAAFIVHPSVSALLNGFIPHLPGFTPNLLFLLMANIGTTIAPWMIFFHQSAVVDKGLKEKHMHYSEVDTGLGALGTVVTATAIIIVTGALLYPNSNIQSAAEAASKLITISPYVGSALAIGLFDAGLLGAIAISLASSWALGEVFGWAHSLNTNVRQAPWFAILRAMILATAGTVVLLLSGSILVVITLFVQVIAVTLLPSAMVFLILLLNSEELVGKYKNKLWQNIAATSIVSLILVLSLLYGVSILFPHLFGG